jgi:hypothetical protein
MNFITEIDSVLIKLLDIGNQRLIQQILLQLNQLVVVAKDGNIASKDPLKVACAFNPKLLEALAAYFNCCTAHSCLAFGFPCTFAKKHQISHHAG